MSQWNLNQPAEDALPPGEVRFLEVRVEPWPEDSRRIRVHMEITPFLERPNIEVFITRPNGQVVASIYIVETMEDRMVFTMHIRGDEVQGQFELQAILSYPEIGLVDQKSLLFETNEKKSL